jgi:hypothetical protein
MTTVNDKLGYIASSTEQQTEIHNGNMFGLDKEGTIPASSSIVLLGKVGAKEIHFHSITGQFAKGGIRISLFEAPTTTLNGTPVSGKNFNRNYSDAHTIQIFNAPTVTDNGTPLPSIFHPLTGVGVNILNANLSIGGGRVLKRNTDYLIKIENTDSSTVAYGINLLWSESTVSTIL